MNNIVDKIYVINLDKDKDRLYNFDRMMKINKWSYERFPAVYGKNLTPEQKILKQKYVNFPLEINPSEIGCLLSHVSLWEKVAYDPEINKILIFEDDACTQLDGSTIVRHINELHTYLQKEDSSDDIFDISTNIIRNETHAKMNDVGYDISPLSGVQNIISDVGYDILYLGKSLDMCMNYEKVVGNVYKNIMPLSLHAYILTKEGTRKLLSMAPFTESIDLVVRKLLAQYNYQSSSGHNRVQFDGLKHDHIPFDGLKGLTFHPSLYFQNVNTYDSNLRNKGASFTNVNECIPNQQYISQNEQTVLIGLIILIILIVFMIIIKYFIPSFIF
jgi:GR25 family glycosyltransferase involved in LPS biosynthesis